MGGSYRFPGSQRLRVPSPPLGGRRAPAGGSTAGTGGGAGWGAGCGGNPGAPPRLPWPPTRSGGGNVKKKKIIKILKSQTKIKAATKTNNKQQQKMFQEENPGDCDALTHLNPQCVIFAPVGRERGRSWCRPPHPHLSSRDCPPGRVNNSTDSHARRQTRVSHRRSALPWRAAVGAVGGARGSPRVGRAPEPEAAAPWGHAGESRRVPEPAFPHPPLFGYTCHLGKNGFPVHTAGTLLGVFSKIFPTYLPACGLQGSELAT